MEEGGTWKILKCISVLVIVVGGLISLLIIKSFSYLDYYELGLKRQVSTGSVSKSEVYSFGRYFIGPDFQFKIFPANVHYIDIEDAKSFTSDKLEVELTAHLQYMIRKDELVALHDAYDLDYKDTIETRALDALKGAVSVYNVRELISNRSDIERFIFKTVRERIGGRCCNYLCGKTNPMCSECIDICTQEDRGLNVEVKYFQLAKIEIPDIVNSQFVQALVEQEQAQEELLKQEAVVVRKETTQQVQVIKNAASEINENATAQAQLITTTSKANYTAFLEAARADGLKSVFADLSFSQQDHKDSFVYLRTIRGQENTHLTVDYQQRIAGNIG